MKHRYPPRGRPQPLELLSGGLLLFLLLFGALCSFLTAVGLTPPPFLILGGCALLTALYTFLCALPTRWMLVGMAAVLGLAGVTVWQFLEVFQRGEIALRCAVVNTVCTSLELDGFIEPIQHLPAYVWIWSATFLALMAGVVLGLLLALTVIRFPSCAASFLLTAPFPLLPLCISVTPAWMPLMALILAWCVMGLGTLARRWDRRGAARLTLLAFPSVALLLALLNLSMPQSDYQRPRWADDALDSINNWVSDLDVTLFSGKGPFGFGSGGSFTDADGKVSLSDAGPLDFSGRTVLEVETDLRGRIYLRGFSSAVYDDNSWEPLDEFDYLSLIWEPVDQAYAQSAILSPTLDGWQPMNFPALADRNTFPDKDYAKLTIRNVGADPGYVYVPYHILSLPDELSGAKFVYDSYLARADDVWTHTVYIQPDCDPLSRAKLPNAVTLAEENYASFVYQSSYLAVDIDAVDAVDAVVQDLATDMEGSLPSGADNPAYREYMDLLYGRLPGDRTLQNNAFRLAMAKIVAAYLDGLAEYDPEAPVTPEGEDFVSYFLTESRRGYCMHFASAATLILRTMGIPARYVTGYVADVPASGKVSVPDSAAHAWVEIYLDGYGWEPVEVTPAYAGSNPGQSGTAEPTPTPTATPAPTATQTPQASAKPSAAPNSTEQPVTETQPLDLRIILIPVAAVLVLLAFPVRRAIGRVRREKKFRQESTNRAVIAVYLYLSRLTRWGGPMPEEVAELAKKAQFSPHILTEEERRTAVDAAHAAALQVDKALPWYKKFLCRYVFGLC